ncbi:LiaI-LiaF-like domain-containing protein [Candidatus Bipolaricaulota bacterium]
MSKRRRRGSLVFPLALLFLGVMFLLTNLDVVDSSIWSQVLRFWPVVLILVGIDALLRHSSIGAAVGGVIGALVLIAAAIALFHLFAPEEWITERHTFAHPLGGVTSAEIVLSCRNCSINVSAQSEGGDSENLINGSLSLRRDEHLRESIRTNEGGIQFRLESDYRLPFPLSAEREAHIWNVEVTESIPLSLSTTTKGAVDLDLTGILIETVDVSTGDDPCTITLPRATDTTVYLSGSRIAVRVPREISVRVTGSASMELTVPDDYIRTEDGILSPNYESASFHSDIVLRPGSEWIEIRRIADEVAASQSI